MSCVSSVTAPQSADGENRSERSRQQPRCYNRRLLQQNCTERTCHDVRVESAKRSSSLRKNLETEPMFSQVRVEFWRWIELWSLRSAVDYAATSLGMRIRL